MKTIIDPHPRAHHHRPVPADVRRLTSPLRTGVSRKRVSLLRYPHVGCYGLVDGTYEVRPVSTVFNGRTGRVRRAEVGIDSHGVAKLSTYFDMLTLGRIKQIDEWIRVFRKTKPAPGTHGPLIPGDPEREAEAIRTQEGVPSLKPVVDGLLDLSKKTPSSF
jgi:hypothetical protein